MTSQNKLRHEKTTAIGVMSSSNLKLEVGLFDERDLTVPWVWNFTKEL